MILFIDKVCFVTLITNMVVLCSWSKKNHEINWLIDWQISDAEWEDMLEGFDERSYLSARRWRPGDDPYTLYAFNQRESERIPSNRALRDTRHNRYGTVPPLWRPVWYTHSLRDVWTCREPGRKLISTPSQTAACRHTHTNTHISSLYYRCTARAHAHVHAAQQQLGARN